MLNKINFFQLDNLINNRVPFVFYNMGPSIADWYSSVTKMHVDAYQKLIPADQIIANVIETKLPRDFAIVLLCNDGKSSLNLFKELEKLSYTNVYVVDGGYQQMVTERSQI